MFDVECSECREEMMIGEDAVTVLREAELAGWPFVIFGGSRHLSGEASWRATAPTLAPGQIAEVRAALSVKLAQIQKAEDFEDRWAEREAERNAPQSEAEKAEAERFLADAEAAHRRREAERPQRIESLLTEIRDALLAKR